MASVPVPLLLALCVCCYTSFGFFSKLYAHAYQGKSATATPVYSIIFGLIVGTSVLAAGAKFQFSASPATWGLGISAGLVLFIYNLCIISASKTGPYALQSIFRCSGNVVVPMLFSVLLWGDQMQWQQFIGILIMLIAFVVINSKGLASMQLSKRFMIWITLLFIANGIFGVLMDAQQRIMQQTERSEMIVITYYSSAVISAIYLLASQKRDALPAFRTGKKAFLYTVAAGLVTAIAVYTLMTALGKMTSSIFYTLQNGLILSLSVVLSAVILKEKIEKNTIFGVILTLISIVLLTI